MVPKGEMDIPTGCRNVLSEDDVLEIRGAVAIQSIHEYLLNITISIEPGCSE